MTKDIVIGEPIGNITYEMLGIKSDEINIITWDRANELEFFLPRILVEVGVFKTTSEVRRINKQRAQSTKIINDQERNLWRTLTDPEFTYFKIGKQTFWLLVGDIDKYKHTK